MVSVPRQPASNRAEARPSLSVAFVLLLEFTLSTFSGFVDALRVAADEVDRSRQLHCRWTVLGPDRSPVRSSCGIDITPWKSFADPGDFDYTVVVGGLVSGHERIDRRILNYLSRVDAGGGSLIGICTGSFALARAGLMKGYRCCVHWAHLDEFLTEFPDHYAAADTVYVVDGRRITCAGGQGGVDVAVHLIERHCGRELGLKVISGMLMEGARNPKHPQPHPETRWFREIKSSLVRRAVLLMEHSRSRKATAHDVAAALGVSAKTLERSFYSSLNLSPSTFFRALRLAHARQEVLNSDKSIGWIATDNGFSDAAHFTRLFRKHYDITPAQARRAGDPALPLRNRGKSAAQSARLSSLDKVLLCDPFLLKAIDWPTTPGAQLQNVRTGHPAS